MLIIQQLELYVSSQVLSGPESNEPVYKSEFVYGIDGQSGFRNIELRALLTQSVLFHE